jgi:hypothetical protein
MDWDRIKSNWKVHGAVAMQRWDRLDESDLEMIGGDRDRLVVFLQDLYGWGKERGETEAELWRQTLNDSATLVTANSDTE